MNEEQIKLHARLSAIEWLLGLHIAETYVGAKWSEERIKERHDGFRAAAVGEATVRSRDPGRLALSAIAYEEALDRLLAGIEAMARQSRGR